MTATITVTVALASFLAYLLIRMDSLGWVWGAI